MRIAAAPISWGVCEVPGLGPRARRGDRAGRNGANWGSPPPNWARPATCRPTRPSCASCSREHELALVGGFLAVPLHDRTAKSTVDEAARSAELLAAGGADVLVLAAATGLDGYDERPALHRREWHTLVETAGKIRDSAVRAGLRTVLHPHVGTHVETAGRGRALPRGLRPPAVPGHRPPAHRRHGSGRPGAPPPGPGRPRAPQGCPRRPRRPGAGRADQLHRGGRHGIYVPLGEGDVDLAGLVSCCGTPAIAAGTCSSRTPPFPSTTPSADRRCRGRTPGAAWPTSPQSTKDRREETTMSYSRARKPALLAAALAVLAMVLAACTGPTAEDRRPRQRRRGATESTRRPLKVAVITHGTAGDAFWNVVKNGAEAAGRELGVAGRLQLRRRPRRPGQADRQRRGAEVGLVVSMANPDALKTSIENAVRGRHPGHHDQLRRGQQHGVRRDRARRPGREDRRPGARASGSRTPARPSCSA